jgi:superfamily I DNA/RNA helicase
MSTIPGARARTATRFSPTKEFLSCLRTLNKSGAKAVMTKVQMAVITAQNTGVLDLAPTHHGETRLPDCEKYDIGSGYRLVVQYSGDHGIFVFVGTHDETDQWLECHKKDRITIDDDRRIASVPVSTAPTVDLSSTFNANAPEDMADQPIVRFRSDDTWTTLGLAPPHINRLAVLTFADWEDGDRSALLMEEISTTYGVDTACLLIDIFTAAKDGRHQDIQPRIDLFLHRRREATASDIAKALLTTANSDHILDFDDGDIIERIASLESWDDWMLFLHPEQKAFAKKDFNGPARLRGISGSGKTCVLVHRARHLAKKYRQPVKVLTFTKSTEQLITLMLNRLCGAERGMIHTATVSSFIQETWRRLDRIGMSAVTLAPDQVIHDAWSRAIQVATQHPGFVTSPFVEWDPADFKVFIKKEAEYVRGRLRDNELGIYLDPKAFPRTGRGNKMTEGMRAIVAAAMNTYVADLNARHLVDFEGIAQHACSAAECAKDIRLPFRCLLIDEVQDLTQMEMNMISRLSLSEGESINTLENGLFLVGDGAQAIYNRGFSLKAAGVTIANRSSLLRKSFRNTFEILSAAYTLIDQYEFSDLDEDDIGRPSEPSMSAQRGLPPTIVKCADIEAEAWFVAHRIHTLIEAGTTPGQICILGNKNNREAVAKRLVKLGHHIADLREDADFSSASVKTSTIESAKGHEFGVVFICGMNRGYLPSDRGNGDAIAKEAAKLYVAMTRARNTLYLTYPASVVEGPSPFLLTIQPRCVEAVWGDGRLSPIRD